MTSSVTSSPGSAASPPAPGAPARLLAFVDESMCRVDEDTLCYFLAAAVIAEDDCPDVRDALRLLVPGKQGILHWRHEAQPRRELITKTIRTCGVESLVVVAAMANPRKQERARRLLLGRLLYDLDERQVSEVVLESRNADGDRRDITAIGGFRNARTLSRRLIVTHGRPKQEPMLWVPDAVAGAAGDHRRGARVCLELLEGLVDVVDLGTV